MSLVGDIVSQLHPEARAEEPAIRNGCRRVPDLDDVEVTLGGESDAGDGLVVVLEEPVGEAVDHAVHEDGMRLRCIDLLRPGAALVILGGVPQGTVAVTHKEEHA